MRVEDKQSVKSTDSGPPKSTIAGAAAGRVLTDKVSVDGVKQVEAVVRAVQTSLSSERVARLQELEVAIRQGRYQPDAGRLAQRIVQAAEVDARLRAIFGG